jgi:hypothetical protein
MVTVYNGRHRVEHSQVELQVVVTRSIYSVRVIFKAFVLSLMLPS